MLERLCTTWRLSDEVNSSVVRGYNFKETRIRIAQRISNLPRLLYCLH